MYDVPLGRAPVSASANARGARARPPHVLDEPLSVLAPYERLELIPSGGRDHTGGGRGLTAPNARSVLGRPSSRARDSVQNEAVADLARLEAPALSDHDLTPEECMALARSAADRIDLGALERGGEGSFELLWRDEHSEAWLNTWWEPRDTGFHDHGGSCVGVYVLDGRATSE